MPSPPQISARELAFAPPGVSRLSSPAKTISFALSSTAAPPTWPCGARPPRVAGLSLPLAGLPKWINSMLCHSLHPLFRHGLPAAPAPLCWEPYSTPSSAPLPSGLPLSLRPSSTLQPWLTPSSGHPPLKATADHRYAARSNQYGHRHPRKHGLLKVFLPLMAFQISTLPVSFASLSHSGP